MKRSIGLAHTLLPMSMTLMLVASCGSGSTPVTSVSTAETSAAVQNSETSVFKVATASPALGAAALLRIDVISSTPETLPPSLVIQEATFKAVKPTIVSGAVSYLADQESAFVPLNPITEVTLAGTTQASVQLTVLSTVEDTTALIYLGDLTEVTFDDFVLVRAVADLPVNLRVPEAIATRANELYSTRAAGPYVAADFDPVPDSSNTNYVIPGSTPAPDLTDALVVYAASFLPANLRTAANIVEIANTLAPGIDLGIEDLAAIPGADLPDGVRVEPPLGPTSAGSFQISVQIENLSDTSLNIGPATYVRVPTPLFPGFTTYVADAASSLLTINVEQINNLEAPLNTCVIIHEPAQDPSSPVNQIARSSACVGAPVGQIRFAQFNASLNRGAEGQLIANLSTPDSRQPQIIAEIIQRVNPDVILINEFDFDQANQAAELFRDNYLAVGQNGLPGVFYPFFYNAPSNTGVASGFDLDNNGTAVTTPGAPGYGNDAYGFGVFPGQFAMVIYSKFPIDEANVRTFQNFLWRDMPGALLPDDPTTPALADWYSPAELDIFRLSSKSHWDVPININGRIIHALASHPTPPVFDPPDVDFNGRRNNDEIRFWADYIVPGAGTYIYDDAEWAAAGNARPANPSGGLTPGASFVIMGDQNSDPNDGDSVPGATDQLLSLSQVNISRTPASLGGPDAARRQGGANNNHISDPSFDTADFADSAPGNLRADYVLPSSDLDINSAQVFWPPSTDPLLFNLVGEFDPSLDPNAFPARSLSSDHRMVWIDLQ